VERRSYTAEQAERTLPFVARVVEDIVAEHARWRALVADLELANATRVVGVEAPRAEALEREVLASAAKLDGYAAELAPLGLVVQSHELGLVDFPATIDGRPAFLCWRLGETAVRFWHERGAGLIGRRPLHSRAA
jgi:hypothetical protein